MPLLFRKSAWVVKATQAYLERKQLVSSFNWLSKEEQGKEMTYIFYVNWDHNITLKGDLFF